MSWLPKQIASWATSGNLRANVVAAVLLLLAQQTFSQVHSNKPIQDDEEAVARALAFTGFDRSCTFRKAPAAVIAQLDLSDTVFSFSYSDTLLGVSTWTIRFDSVAPLLASGSQVATEHMEPIARDFTVVIDASSGKLIEVRSVLAPQFAKDSSSFARLRRQISEDSSSRTGVSLGLPELSLLDVLTTEVGRSICYHCPEIMIYLGVRATDGDSNSATYWQINQLYIGQASAIGGEIPEGPYVICRREEISAQTGVPIRLSELWAVVDSQVAIGEEY